MRASSADRWSKSLYFLEAKEGASADGSAPWILRIATSNPFYLCSAGLILFGIAQGVCQIASPPLAARFGAFSLAAYALLMAAVGVFLVRHWNVWDDARTVLLIILLCFAGMSVGFDELALHSPNAAAPWLIGAFVFAVALTEGVLWLVGMPWPMRWRLPYCAFLALLFFAPLLATPAWGAHTADLRVLMFPCLGGLAVLGLIPAAHGGHAGRPEAPWKWPYYPWAIFTLLIVGVAGRSALLSLSFVVDTGLQTAFAAYFLYPIAWAVLVVLMEGAVGPTQSQSSNTSDESPDYARPDQLAFTQWAAPAMLLLLGQPTTVIRMELWNDVTELVASPQWLGALGLLAFYVWSYARGVRPAYWGVCLSLALLGFVQSPGAERWMPLGATTPWLILSVLLVIHKSEQPTLVRAIALFFLAATVARETVFAQPGNIAATAIAAAMCSGFVHHDELAKTWRRWTAWCFAAAPWFGAIAMFNQPEWIEDRLPLTIGIATALVVLPVTGWFWRRESWWLVSLRSIGVFGLAGAAVGGHEPLQRGIGTTAAVSIQAGITLLAAGVYFSWIKANRLPAGSNLAIRRQAWSVIEATTGETLRGN